MQELDKGTEVSVTIDDVLDEQPELPLEAKQPDPKPAAKEPAADDEVSDVAKIKAELEAAKARAAEAEALRIERDRLAAYAAQQQREAMAARGNAQLSQYDMITSALGNAEREREVLKAAYREAFETGDGARAADVQAQLSDLAVRIRDLSEGKSKIEEMAEAQRRQAAQPRQTAPQQAVRQPADPRQQFEAAISSFSEPSKQWIRAHPDAFMDQSKWKRVVQLDAVAQYNGHKPDSPEYFAFIDREMGYAPASDSRQTSRQTSYAAPVRGGGSVSAGGSASPTKVRLTPEQLKTAELLEMTPQEYAKGLLMTQRKS